VALSLRLRKFAATATYAAPTLTIREYCAGQSCGAIARFMAAITGYWAERRGSKGAAKIGDADAIVLISNIVASAAFPPLLGLPVRCLASARPHMRAPQSPSCRTRWAGPPQGRLCPSRVTISASNRVTAFTGARSCAPCSGRAVTAPIPRRTIPEQLMCRDPEATFDAL